jgi:lipopolysaccharide transport system ATP-binding protein
MKPIIEVQNLSKKYQINAKQQRYSSLRESIGAIFSFNKNKTKEDFWALQDINFTVEAGESIGIIGSNGAGKSTLLKILSRITPPTKGNIILRGRISSLLEVGTGFHPELTGRENVYFNGSILGLRKAEIDKKFDEIVDFSGVEQFIDTPLKTYSSGMQMRLAFAVAAHLESEILIIDEVLAVGDAEFQKKCLGKMDDVNKSGRTILFVSHNINAIKSLCQRGIYLYQGSIKSEDTIDNIVNSYLTQNIRTYPASLELEPTATSATFTKIALLNAERVICNIFKCDEPITIKMEFNVLQIVDDLELAIGLSTLDGTKIFFDNSKYSDKGQLNISQRGLHTIFITLPVKVLMPNTYLLNIALLDPHIKVYDFRRSIILFTIEDRGRRITIFKSSDQGLVDLSLSWQHQRSDK